MSLCKTQKQSSEPTQKVCCEDHNMFSHCFKMFRNPYSEERNFLLLAHEKCLDITHPVMIKLEEDHQKEREGSL